MNQTHDMNEQIVHLIKNSSLSSISIISERTGIPTEQTLTILREAIDKGMIQGVISQDETRFYRTDLETSSPPSTQRDIEFIKTSSPLGKFVVIAGFIAFIAGQILVRVVSLDTLLWEIGSSIVVMSIFIIALGFGLASRVTIEKRVIGEEIAATVH